MPIYDLFETKESKELDPETASTKKDRFLSSLTARLLFFLLFIGNLAWAVYSCTIFLVMTLVSLVSCGKLGSSIRKKRWVALKRAGICGISLFIALFSPALGIMIACTYFLMYDQRGIQEVIPQSLQDQFQEFLN